MALSVRAGLWRPSLLALVLLTGGIAAPAPLDHAFPPAAAARPAAADEIATHLATVRVAYGQLLDAFQRPVAPPTLLQPAVDALRDAAQRAGVALPAGGLPDDRDAAFAVFAAAYTQIAGGLDDGDARDLAFGAIDAMARSLHDDHTSFINPPSLTAFAADLGVGTTVGAGFSIGSAATPYVEEVAPSGPAEQAGLRPGDALLAIGGQTVTQRSVFELGGQFRAGSAPVAVRVQSPDGPVRELSITPGPYSFPEWSGAVLPGGVGLMRLRNFIDPWRALPDGRTIDMAITDTLRQFEAAGVRLWVLDLLGNPGGSGLLIDALTGRFVPDAPVDRQFDQRGHLAGDRTDGRLFPVQRPLAVLVDRHSTSAADLSASVFKESGRAILVGERTGGALGNAAIWPIGDGAGLEVSFADIHSGVNDTVIDHVGVPVDVTAPARTAADYAAGRDPQLDAAVAALWDRAATPLPAPAQPSRTGGQAIADLLGRYRPRATELVLAPDMAKVEGEGGYTLTTYNDYNNWATATVMTSGSGGGRDSVATRELARQRGWLGGRIEVYGDSALGPALWARWDLYGTNAGADAALQANDFPDQRTPFDAPLTLGDGATVAERGAWGDLGTVAVRWRHGSVVFSAEYQAAPGGESVEAATAFAREVDAAYAGARLSPAFGLVVEPLLRALVLVEAAR